MTTTYIKILQRPTSLSGHHVLLAEERMADAVRKETAKSAENAESHPSVGNLAETEISGLDFSEGNQFKAGNLLSKPPKPRAILTSREAVAIFRHSLPAEGSSSLEIGIIGSGKRLSAIAVARIYGVNEKTVRDIWTGRTWYLQLDLNISN